MGEHSGLKYEGKVQLRHKRSFSNFRTDSELKKYFY